ncbi:hypothetical protein WJX73_004697 [Symbiochloris irregularis]|uniref:J domain-containing protein n=1 Tax=Symbiochloris irregularis TaxID=706552 RepID=A0AAW1PY39_9CHLO
MLLTGSNLTTGFALARRVYLPAISGHQFASDSYFDLFGLRSGFDVDPKELEAAYKDLQRRHHPDRHAMGSEEDQERSAEQSTLVNQAYATLKKPLQRAKYVLAQAGHAEASVGEGTIEDPELLMKVMEARELVESLADSEQLQQLRKENADQQERCIQELGSAFRERSWHKAIELTTELRYITRIGEAISQKL